MYKYLWQSNYEPSEQLFSLSQYLKASDLDRNIIMIIMYVWYIIFSFSVCPWNKRQKTEWNTLAIYNYMCMYFDMAASINLLSLTNSWR